MGRKHTQHTHTVKALMFFLRHTTLVKSRYDVSLLPRFGLLLSSLSRPSSTAQTTRPFHYKTKPLSSGQNNTVVVLKPSFTRIFCKTVPGKPYLIFNEKNSWIPQHKVQTPFPSSRHASPTIFDNVVEIPAHNCTGCPRFSASNRKAIYVFSTPCKKHIGQVILVFFLSFFSLFSSPF